MHVNYKQNLFRCKDRKIIIQYFSISRSSDQKIISFFAKLLWTLLLFIFFFNENQSDIESIILGMVCKAFYVKLGNNVNGLVSCREYVLSI